MIRRSVALLAMIAVTSTALAQQPPSAPPQWHGHHGGKDTAAWRQKMEQRRMERLTVLLDLTAAQRQQVQAIFSDEHAKTMMAMQQVQQAMKQARAAHEAAHKETLHRLSSVLSPAQMKKLEALMPPRGMMMHHMMMHEMMMHHMGHDMDMGAAPPPPEPGPGPGAQ